MTDEKLMAKKINELTDYLIRNVHELDASGMDKTFLTISIICSLAGIMLASGIFSNDDEFFVNMRELTIKYKEGYLKIDKELADK